MKMTKFLPLIVYLFTLKLQEMGQKCQGNTMQPCFIKQSLIGAVFRLPSWTLIGLEVAVKNAVVMVI